MSQPDLTLTRGDRWQAYSRCCMQEPYRIEIAEWVLSLAMAVVGLHMLLWPAAIGASHMHLLTDSFPHSVIAGICLLLGTARLATISRPRLARSHFQLRGVLAIVSAAIWLEMAFAFASRFVGQVPPPGLDMLIIVQVVGDLWVVYRIKAHFAQLRRKGVLK